MGNFLLAKQNKRVNIPSYCIYEMYVCTTCKIESILSMGRDIYCEFCSSRMEMRGMRKGKRMCEIYVCPQCGIELILPIDGDNFCEFCKSKMVSVFGATPEEVKKISRRILLKND